MSDSNSSTGLDSNFGTLLTAVDDIKQSIPDQKYRDILDATHQLHKSMSSDTKLSDNIFTELWYIIRRGEKCRVMFTEGSGYVAIPTGARSTFCVPMCNIIIHMPNKGCFSNEWDDHHTKLFFTETVDMHLIIVPAGLSVDSNPKYDLTLLDITGIDDDYIELVFKTNRSIPQISSCLGIKDALLDYVYRLAQLCPPSDA
jgi:hypothetical protein